MKTTVIWQTERGKITYKHFHTSDFLDYEDTDRIGIKRGYGKTVIIRTPSAFKYRILTFARDFFNGIHEKIPVCCVLNFCIDTVLDRPSAQLRWSDNTDHVECFLHARTHTKKAIPLDLY
jgi:hypothetical protein